MARELKVDHFSRLSGSRGIKTTQCLDSDSAGLEADVRQINPAQAAVEPCEIDRVLHFQFLRELGEGGMGKVFVALDELLDRQVAVKLLLSTYVQNQKLLEYFLREAKYAAAVNHPHVIRIYYTGVENGCPFMVMELLKGKSLYELLGELGRIPEALALSVAIEAVEGLQAAFAHGIIHSDINPSNLFIDEHQGTKVLDFGLAGLSSQQSCRADGIIGTIPYVSPERVKGEPEHFRSDIFSLGATLYHVLSGRKPFDDRDPQRSLQKRLKAIPPKLMEIVPGIHWETSEVVARMMNPDLYQRHTSYDELLCELRDAREAVVKDTRDLSANSKALLRHSGMPSSISSGFSMRSLAILGGMLGTLIGCGIYFFLH